MAGATISPYHAIFIIAVNLQKQHVIAVTISAFIILNAIAITSKPVAVPFQRPIENIMEILE